MTPDVLMTILKIAVVFIAVSFVIFWVGMVWWVSQDVLSRTSDKVIISAAVAMTAILGPVGMLLYLIIRPKQTIQESVGEMMEREMLLHASSSTICPTCGRMAQENFVSCPHCGTKIKDHCPQCKQLVSVDWEHCPYCEAHLRASRASLATPAESMLNLPTSQASQSQSVESAAHRRRHRRTNWSVKMHGMWHSVGQVWEKRLRSATSKLPSPERPASTMNPASSANKPAHQKPLTSNADATSNKSTANGSNSSVTSSSSNSSPNGSSSGSSTNSSTKRNRPHRANKA